MTTFQRCESCDKANAVYVAMWDRSGRPDVLCTWCADDAAAEFDCIGVYAHTLRHTPDDAAA